MPNQRNVSGAEGEATVLKLLIDAGYEVKKNVATKTWGTGKGRTEFGVTKNGLTVVVECHASGGGSADKPKAIDEAFRCLKTKLPFVVVVMGRNKNGDQKSIDKQTSVLKRHYDEAVETVLELFGVKIDLVCCTVETLSTCLQQKFT
jgi:hypothetical protein